MVDYWTQVYPEQDTSTPQVQEPITAPGSPVLATQPAVSGSGPTLVLAVMLGIFVLIRVLAAKGVKPAV